MTPRIAALDCGTNSIRLLVADVVGPGELRDVVRRMEIVRLGYGVDKTGRIDDAAMERTLAMCREYAQQCRELGVGATRFVATSAARDAANAAEFVAGVKAAFADFGTVPEVISGREEAGLSFRGATGDVSASGAPAPYLLVDIGGGSTELVRGRSDVEQVISVDMGCVRMTERHLVGDPPTPDQIHAATRDVDAILDVAEETVDLSGIGTLVGVAGSVTALTAYTLGLPMYQPERVHLARLDLSTVLGSCDALLRMTRSERAAIPSMHPGRVDVIGAGALVWSRLVRRVADRSPAVTATITSEHDILDGIALSIV